MAFTYLILNVLVVTVVAIALSARIKKPSPSWWITFAILLILTLVFDNIFIKLGAFSYNPELILGLKIGAAPIEDFFYPLLACIVVPLLWNRFKLANYSHRREKNND